MPSRREKVGAGVFLLTTVLLAFATVMVVAGITWGRATLQYQIRFADSVQGLTRGSDVVYLGVHVGKVREVRTEVGAVLAHIDVERGTPIKTGTYALLDTNLLTGATHIELRGGEPGEDDLPEGSELRWERNSFSAVEDRLPGAVGGLEEIISHVKELLRPQNREALEQLVGTLDEEITAGGAALRATLADVSELRTTADRLVASLEKELSALRGDLTGPVESTLEEFGQTSRSVGAAADELGALSGDLRRSSAELPELIAQLQSALGELQRTTRTLGDAVVHHRADVEETLGGLRRSTRTMEELLLELRHNPWTVVRGEAAEETAPVGR